MSSPRVSVIIPAYNAMGTIAASVESVLKQDLSDLEIIVVDDGSTDDTFGRVSAIDDPRVRVLRQRNGGVAKARNTGIRAASGRYVAFLDADDLWRPCKLQRQIEAMKREAARASQTAVWFVDEGLRPLFRGHCPDFKDPLLEVLLFRHLPGFSSTFIAERSLLQEIGLFDEGLAILEDWEMAIRVARYGPLVNLDEALTLYRIHPDNRSRDLNLHLEPGFVVLDRLFADPQLPSRIRDRKSRIYAGLFAMYAGGAFKTGDVTGSVKWVSRAVRRHPGSVGSIAMFPIRRIRRRFSRQRAPISDGIDSQT